MNQLFYVLQFLLRGKGNNTIKIISLTLGLVTALLLFSKVSFELSYDTSYPGVDRLYRIERKVTLKGDPAYDGPVIPGAIPGGIRDEIAGVEKACITFPLQKETEFLYGQTLYKEKMQVADSSFFDMFGIQLLEGNKDLLGVPSNIFLSCSQAKRMFGNGNAVGETLLMNRLIPLTVAGVYADIPANSHLYTDIILSMESAIKLLEYELDWVMNDSFYGYLKLYPGVSPEGIEGQIQALIDKHTQESMFAMMGIEAVYSLMPVSSIHSGDPTVKKTIWILTLLAFSLLVVAAMNYVLISISSLVKRAKAIGVHKCNGASSANIFTQFIYETAILVGIAFLFSLVLIGVFREPIQTLLQLPVTRIFSLSNLYVTIFVISTILLTAGFIPGWIFSSIPVTQVFRTYTITNRYWKRLLLFVQFGEIAFIVSLLWIIVKQYEMILHKDMGYTVENVVYTVGAENISGEQFALLKQEFERIPQVLHASLTERLPVEEMGGFPVMDENGEHMLFSARQMWADRDYPEAFGINLKMGTTFPENAEHLYVLVNESFVNAMQWKESPVGKGFNISGMEVQVAGVVNNYQLLSFYAQRAAMLQDIPPLIIFSLHPVWHTGSGNKKLVLRLQDTDLSLLSTLNNKLRELLNSEEVYFMDYQTRIVYSYKEARLFRNSILVAAIVMLVIAILGIIGYVQDEMNRRSKEIGIRKINGATATDILVAISKDIVAISIPSLLVGIAVAYFAGQQWLLQFAEKIPLNGILFATSGGFVLLVILLCVVLRAWNTANENPVYSIKAE